MELRLFLDPPANQGQVGHEWRRVVYQREVRDAGDQLVSHAPLPANHQRAAQTQRDDKRHQQGRRDAEIALTEVPNRRRGPQEPREHPGVIYTDILWPSHMLPRQNLKLLMTYFLLT